MNRKASLTIHPEIRYQRIDNFGASDAWSMEPLKDWSDEGKNRLADLLFSTTDGAGLSCWRVNIGGGINHKSITVPWRTCETYEVAPGQYDFTRSSGQRWFVDAARKRGVPKFLAFAITPPTRLTLNGLTNCTDGKGSINLRPGMEGEFARYLADILCAFPDKESGRATIFDYLSPINEPEWEWNGDPTPTSQEGTRASWNDIRRVMDAIQAEFSARGLPTRQVAFETADIKFLTEPDEKMSEKYGAPFGDYVRGMVSDQAWTERIQPIIGYHSYWSDLKADIVPMRTTAREGLNQLGNPEVWQTEYCQMKGPDGEGGMGRDLGMRLALNVARLMHYDLTIVGVSAWQWWLACSNVEYKDGLVYFDWDEPGDSETLFPSKLLWVMAQYSRFVRPGATRVECKIAAPEGVELLASSYEDESATKLVTVVTNISTKQIELSLDSHPTCSSIEAYVTSDRPGDDCRHLGAVKDHMLVPSRSVVTLVAHLS